MDPSDNIEMDRLSQHSIHQLTQQSSSSSPHHENSHDGRPDTIVIKQSGSPVGDHGQSLQQASLNRSMDVDQNAMESEPLHGMIITPEIATMMNPSHMGKFFLITNKH